MIVVTTPTGKISSQLVPHLLSAGERVRVIARDPSKLSPEIRGKVEVVQGSTDDPVILDKAFAGAEALFWLVPPAFIVDDVNEYFLSFARLAADAIKTQDVERVVAVSGLYRDPKRYAGAVWAPRAMDEVIESTGVDYRALWCANFMENMLQQIEPIKHRGIFFLPAKPDVKTPLVATRDIAATAAKLLLDKSWTGQGGVAVMGPQDLSYNDMAETMSEVLGKLIRFQQISGDAFKAQLMTLGASEAYAQWLVRMFAEIDDGVYGTAPRTPENTTPTSFRQWCEEVFKPVIQC